MVPKSCARMVVVIAALSSSLAMGQELLTSDDLDQQQDQQDQQQQQVDQEAEELLVAEAPTVRQFHGVLSELLAEFGYDVRTGQIKGLKNLAIRKVTVNDALPFSYRTYVENLVAERIRENSRIRLISCVSCKNRVSRMVDGKIIITSPTTNMSEMDRAATELGIDNFMDVILVYHTTHMVLAFQVYDSETKELTWARTYNSETVKSRFQRLAVDYSQIHKSRSSDTYEPEFRYLLGIGGATIPNVTGESDDNGFLLVHLRATEKFNNRRNEAGLMMNLYQNTNLFLNDYPTEGGTPATGDTEDVSGSETDNLTPFTTALAIYMAYGHNFVGAIESYNTARHGLNVGVGLLLAASYLAPTVRVGWDMYFGRSFGVTLAGVFVAPSSVLVSGQTVDVDGGAGGELAAAYNF